MTYPTIEEAIGHTPLVVLQRIGAQHNAERGNVILGKLEGNNPAGYGCSHQRLSHGAHHARGLVH
jgi:cysteine synthase